MTNLFAPPRYDERIDHLLVGVEPRDAVAGGRLPGPLRVLVEDNPVPLHRWRCWRQGETLDTALGGLDLHPSGRFARVEGRTPAGSTLVVRVVEPLRRIVPRRLTLDLTAQRTFPVGLFPGAGAAVPTGATVVRGRVTRLVDPGTGERAPVRWARVRATDLASPDPAEVGWAHGDDRGEFVLVVGHADTAIVVPPTQRALQLTVGAVLPTPPPDPTDPLRPAVDPLWDLPPEPLAAHGGRALLAGQTTFGPFPFTVPLGRETSIEIGIP